MNLEHAVLQALEVNGVIDKVVEKCEIITKGAEELNELSTKGTKSADMVAKATLSYMLLKAGELEKDLEKLYSYGNEDFILIARDAVMEQMKGREVMLLAGLALVGGAFL